MANQGSRGDGGKEPEAWLLDGEDGFLVTSPTLTRIRSKARNAIGRPDLRLHDLRHSGLTWAAATGAILAEVMRRAGHESPTAALRYQRATEDDRKGAVMFGEEMIDEASRKMATKFVSRGERAGLRRSES